MPEVSERRVLESYDVMLDSYAQTLNLSRGSVEMQHVEGALFVLLEKGADRDPALSPREIVALAGIVGKISATETGNPDRLRHNEEVYRATMKRIQYDALIAATGWVVPAPAPKPARSEDEGSFLRRLCSILLPGTSDSSGTTTPATPDRRKTAMLLAEKLDKYFPERQPASASV